MNTKLKWVLIAFAIFAVLFAVGCTKSVLEEEEPVYRTQSSGGAIKSQPMIAAIDVEMEYDASNSAPSMYRKYYPPEEHYGSGDDIEVELKIIRTASMSVEVEDYFLASQKVEAYAKKYGGYVSNSNSGSDYRNKQSGTITIRVPELHFDAALAEISMLGEVKSKNMGGDDVTEQYIDLQSRINNSKAHEKRLVKMYENASNVHEMMNVERELSRVRGDIERMEGRLRYMDNRVEMSTITVHLYEPRPVVKEWGVWRSVKNALNHSLSTLRFMIEMIGWLLPLIVTGVLVYALVKWRRRKVRHRRR